MEGPSVAGAAKHVVFICEDHKPFQVEKAQSLASLNVIDLAFEMRRDVTIAVVTSKWLSSRRTHSDGAKWFLGRRSSNPPGLGAAA